MGDTEMTEEGGKQVNEAAQKLKRKGYKFDCAFTSMLSRANDSLENVLLKLNQTNIPVHKSWMLNEIHYGELTGLTWDEALQTYGEYNLRKWLSKSYCVNYPLGDHAPPLMKESHPD